MQTQPLSRRRFLGVLAATLLLAGCSEDKKSLRESRIGLALGAGGAKGLAHTVIFEALDELAIRPHVIAGTSMGAIMGAMYASGLSGSDIRALINKYVVTDEDTWSDALLNKDILRWTEIIDPELGRGGLLSGDGFIRVLQDNIKSETFADLKIPLKVVAADLRSSEEHVFDKGPLKPALQASIAIPGIFSPVIYNHTAYVDGSTVNPVPYDLLLDECDITIAVDVSGSMTPDDDDSPSYFDTIFTSLGIMQEAIMREKLKQRPPDIYLRPDIRDIRLLEFYAAESIFRQAEPVKKRLRQQLRRFA
ncbi:MAG: patatin-like phospholipase family protein [Gammaproteobacteria bacterium]|nr:MAG: patatin-like phospholipase family protein [Gammaproteobacteria bacterium]